MTSMRDVGGDNPGLSPERSMSTPRPAARGVRSTAFGAVVMLLVQYGLGVWLIFEGGVPSADQGAGLWDGFIDAITQGPLALSLHALVGTLRIVSAVSLTVRAIRLAHRLWSPLTSTALAAVLFAWLAGVRLVSTGTTGAAVLMALLTAVALLCYSLMVFTMTFGNPE